MKNKKMNKYIEFIEPFKDIHGSTYPFGVKFRITSEDNDFYYISNWQAKIDKYLEGELFKVGEIVYGS